MASTEPTNGYWDESKGGNAACVVYQTNKIFLPKTQSKLFANLSWITLKIVSSAINGFVKQI